MSLDSLPLSVLLCLSVIQLSLGWQHQIIVAQNVNRLDGWRDKSPDAQDVQAAASYAVQKLNSRSNEKNFKLVFITSAQSQVTNMINFKIGALLGETKCLKTEGRNEYQCELGEKHLACQFRVRFNPRNNEHILDDSSCQKTSVVLQH